MMNSKLIVSTAVLFTAVLFFINIIYISKLCADTTKVEFVRDENSKDNLYDKEFEVADPKPKKTIIKTPTPAPAPKTSLAPAPKSSLAPAPKSSLATKPALVPAPKQAFAPAQKQAPVPVPKQVLTLAPKPASKTTSPVKTSSAKKLETIQKIPIASVQPVIVPPSSLQKKVIPAQLMPSKTIPPEKYKFLSCFKRTDKKFTDNVSCEYTNAAKEAKRLATKYLDRFKKFKLGW